MHFQKQDMEGTQYNWALEGERSSYMGQPSRRTFDRYNGDQVLFLINFLRFTFRTVHYPGRKTYRTKNTQRVAFGS